MKKLDGFESYLAIAGLNEMRELYKKDIEDIIARGKNPIMTAGFVDMKVNEAIEKIKSLTLKQK